MVRYECYGNCPNCGAPIESDICEYCGTRFRTRDTGSATNEVYEYSGMLCEKGVLTMNEVRRLLGLSEIKIVDARKIVFHKL